MGRGRGQGKSGQSATQGRSGSRAGAASFAGEQRPAETLHTVASVLLGRPTLQEMSATNIPEMAALDGLCFSAADAWSEDVWHMFMARPGARAIGATAADGSLVGYAIGIKTWDNARHLGSLAVHPDARRCGVGAALRQRLLELTQDDEGYVTEIRESNAPMLALSIRQGFVRAVGAEWKRYADGERAVTMIRPPLLVELDDESLVNEQAIDACRRVNLLVHHLQIESDSFQQRFASSIQANERACSEERWQDSLEALLTIEDELAAELTAEMAGTWI